MPDNLANEMLLDELRRMNTAIERVDSRLDSKISMVEDRIFTLHTDLLTLRTKASVWGAIGGVLFGTITSAVITFLAAAR